MSFFKAYDMRGTFGVDFDLDTVYRVGRHLPEVVRGVEESQSRAPFRVLIGRDARAASPAVRDALAAGLAEAGAEMVDLGLATTPMVYFYTAREGFDASVQITASHNPPADDGLKVSRRGALPVGYESGLAELERLVSSDPAGLGSDRRRRCGAERSADAPATDPERLDAYVRWLLDNGGTHTGLRVAVDCSDGMASILAHRLFPGAVFLNDVLDGRFPNHSPNPLLPEARAQLAEAVRSKGLDCGVIFDGDADRCMFVDETGAFIQPDYLIPVLADTFPPESGKTVIHDVRTSRAAIEALSASGCRPVMGKVGHAYAKVLLREVHAVCGGELAGHYYFRDFFGCDSGELAALRILGAFADAKANGKTVSEFIAPVAGKYANSGELNFKVQDKPAAIERVLAAARAFGAETGRSGMDGVRLEFAEGWISVRASNTEPYLRLIAETDTQERLGEWLGVLEPAISG